MEGFQQLKPSQYSEMTENSNISYIYIYIVYKNRFDMKRIKPLRLQKQIWYEKD